MSRVESSSPHLGSASTKPISFLLLAPNHPGTQQLHFDSCLKATGRVCTAVVLLLLLRGNDSYPLLNWFHPSGDGPWKGTLTCVLCVLPLPRGAHWRPLPPPPRPPHPAPPHWLSCGACLPQEEDSDIACDWTGGPHLAANTSSFFINISAPLSYFLIGSSLRWEWNGPIIIFL